jgi:hypothetical protein
MSRLRPNARDTGRWHSKRKRTHGRHSHVMGKARRGPSYKYRMSPPCHKSARTRSHTHIDHTCAQRCNPMEMHEMHTHMRAHKGTHAQTHAHGDARGRTQTRARTDTRIHFTHRRTRTHTKPCTRPRSLHAHACARTDARTNVPRNDACLYNSIGRCIFISYGAERATQIESEMNAVRACVRASVWVCARACARAEIHVSLSRENGRLQARARVRACVDPRAVQNTRHNRLSTQEYPHRVPAESL